MEKLFTGVLGALSIKEQEKIFSVGEIIKVYKGQIIIKEGSNENDLYLIQEGTFKGYKVDELGRELTLMYFKSGDFVGEISFLTQSPRTANIIAQSSGTLIKLTRDQFASLTKEYQGLLYLISKELAFRLKYATDKFASSVFKDVVDRLKRVLQDLSEDSYLSEPEEKLVRTEYSIQELASLVGTSREVVSRGIKALTASGELRKEGKMYWVKN